MKSFVSLCVLVSFVNASSDYVSFTYGYTNDDCETWSSTNQTKFQYNCMKVEDLPSASGDGLGCFSSVILGHGKVSGSLKGHRWTSELKMDVTKASSAGACQAHCQRTKNCAQFMWNKKSQKCSLRTFRETAASLSTRVDDIVADSSALPALSDPRWSACDLSLLNDCSTHERSCVTCENHPRCLVNAPSVISGPKYCSRYTPFDWCSILPKTEPSDTFFADKPLSGRCARSSGFDVLFLQEATEQAAVISDFLRLTASTIKPLLEASAMAKTTEPLKLAHATFKDKPVAPYGDAGDYCFKVTQGLTDDNEVFAAAVESVKASGGGDSASDQFGALVASSSSQKIGWRDDSTRVIVLVTSSISHFSTKISKSRFDISPRGADFVDSHSDDFCAHSDYSVARDLRIALKMKNNHEIVFLTTFGAEFDYWKWINQYIGQSDEFVQVLEEDGSNLIAALSAGLSAVLSACDRELIKHSHA